MSDDFLAWLQELFSTLGRTRARAMFGGHGLYFEDRIFGIAIDQRLYLKVDELSAPGFRAAGCAPFVYEGGGRRVEMSYWTVPDEAMDSAEAMAPWLRLAWEAALRKPERKAKAVGQRKIGRKS